MSRSTENYAVLFADICESTKLYNALGDVAARSVVNASLTLVWGVVERFRGRVVKAIGDELMCVFKRPDDAVQAATSMQAEITNQRIGKRRVRLHVGLHYGPVLVENDDFFGDTVNAAAYLTAVAAPEQILTTVDTERNLSPGLKGMVRPVFKVVLKGSTEESTVYQVVWHQDVSQLTDVNLRSHNRSIPGDEGSLVLAYRNVTLRLDQTRPHVTIGRGNDCDLVVTEKLASRNHVSIRLLRTHFYLLDTSLNGTFVTLENGEEVHVLRGELLLGGSGRTTLGRTVAEGAEAISFTRDRRSIYRV